MEERIFLAGFIGVMISEVCLQSRVASSRAISTLLLRAACAGYVVLFVLALDRVYLAFATGLAFDAVIAGLRTIGSKCAMNNEGARHAG